MLDIVTTSTITKEYSLYAQKISTDNVQKKKTSTDRVQNMASTDSIHREISTSSAHKKTSTDNVHKKRKHKEVINILQFWRDIGISYCTIC